MIRKSPSERYIQYLIVDPRGYSNEDIMAILLYDQLDGLGGYYLNRLRGQLPPLPKPFLPTDRGHKASQTYLLKNGLHYFFWPDRATKTAFKILGTPRAKEFVEATLIAHAPYQAIAKFLTQSRGIECHPIDVQRYRDYFWNVDLLDSTELRLLFDQRVRILAAHPDPEIAAYARSYKNALYADARRAAAELPHSPVASTVAQMKMGLMPSNKDFAKLVEATRSLALAKAFESAASDVKGAHMRFKMFASGAKDLTEILSYVARPEEELRDQLAQIALKSDKDHLPTLKRLGESSLNTHILEAHGESIYPDSSEEQPEPGSSSPDAGGRSASGGDQLHEGN